jgi:hypothetical protein
MKTIGLAILLSVAAFAHDNDDHHKPQAVTPEPGTIGLMAIGLAGLGVLAARKARK